MAILSVKEITHPFGLSTVRGLRLGDRVSLSGPVVTGRDFVHRHLFDGAACPVTTLENGVMFHCGPIALAKNGSWEIKAIGPTTSMREEPYMAKLIARFKIRVLIGKGGMGPDTQKACAQTGCVYLSAVGGAAQVLAQSVAAVKGVHFLREFGPTEALWELEIKDFPAIVTMDARGRSLHKKIADSSRKNLKRILTKSSRW